MIQLYRLSFIFGIIIISYCQDPAIIPVTYDLINSTNSQNITIINQQEDQWVVNISIGVPAQTFLVIVDTGSGVLWVPYYTCTNCKMTNRFNPKGTLGFNNTGQDETLYYGKGTAEGFWAYDIVGITNTSVSFSNFYMMFATYETGFPYGGQEIYSGIMGLCQSAQSYNIFDDSYQIGASSSPLYGLSLQPQPYPSYLIYGTIDPYILNNVVWVNTLDEYNYYYWTVELEQISFGGVQQNLGNITTGILDSGTSCLVLSQNLYDNYIKNYAGACSDILGITTCPCGVDDQINLANITLGFQGVNVTIPYQNILTNYYNQTNGSCQLCLQQLGNPANPPFMIFGAPVFKSMIALFNKTGNQVGILVP